MFENVKLKEKRVLILPPYNFQVADMILIRRGGKAVEPRDIQYQVVEIQVRPELVRAVVRHPDGSLSDRRWDTVGMCVEVEVFRPKAKPDTEAETDSEKSVEELAPTR